MLPLLLALAVPGFTELKQQFNYDAAAPLSVERKLLFERDGVKAFDVTFASPKGGRVTAYLTVPAKRGSHPGILFGHWGPGNRTEFLPEARIYSRAGAVCLMIDWPWRRPAPWHADADDIEEPQRAVKLHAQAVIDLRRGLDLLTSEPGVDARRLAYAGHSYGAQFGAILAAVDKRLKTAVLMAGIPDMDANVLGSQSPGAVQWRARTGEAKIAASLEVLRATAAVQYVRYAAPAPLLFQFARYEADFDEAAMRRYFDAASEPKTVLWYEAGHDLNDPRALGDRARWLGRHLRIRGIGFALRHSMGE